MSRENDKKIAEWLGLPKVHYYGAVLVYTTRGIGLKPTRA